MTSVAGLLKIGEAQATMRSIGTRQRGATYSYSIVLVALTLLGAAAGVFVLNLLPHLLDRAHLPSVWQPEPLLVIGAGAICGAFVYQWVGKWMLVARFRKRLMDKGAPLNLQLRMEITPDALLYEVGDVQQIAKWSCVSEIFRSHDYWIFLAQSDPYFAPERFFTNEDAERAFVADALAHMNEAAQARSPEAVAFAKTQG